MEKSEGLMTAIRAAMAFIPAQLTHFRGWKLNQSGASGTRETCHCEFTIRRNPLTMPGPGDWLLLPLGFLQGGLIFAVGSGSKWVIFRKQSPHAGRNTRWHGLGGALEKTDALQNTSWSQQRVQSG